MSTSNTNTNSPLSINTSEQITSSNTTPPPPRPDGLTAEQALQRQDDILNDYYLDHSAVDQNKNSAPEVEPVVTTPQRKTKALKKASATTGVSDGPTPPKKAKSVSKPTITSNTSPDITPSRRSERNKNKKRPATEDAAELGSPLAKKKKTTSDLADPFTFVEPPVLADSLDSPPTPALIRALKRKGLMDATRERPSSAKKSKAAPVAANSIRRMRGDASRTPTPVPAPIMSKKKVGKLPVKDDQPLDVTAYDQSPSTADDLPASTPADAAKKRVILKLKMKHIPTTTTRSAAKKGKKTQAPDLDQDVEQAEPDEADDDDAGQPSGSKKPGKTAAPRRVIIPSSFVGNVGGMGTCTNKPTLDPSSNVSLLDKPWLCGNRHCNTGMTWLPRDGPPISNAFGRKTCSQFFGHNKRETGRIHNDVWHISCRKCYQRKFYALTKQTKAGEQFKDSPMEGAAHYHMTSLRAQFRRLKLWRPDATFNVNLSKAMLTRSNGWHEILRQHSNDADAATVAFAEHKSFKPKERKPAKDGKTAPLKPEEIFPVQLVDAFVQNPILCGEKFDYDQVDAVLDHIQSMLDAGTIQAVPPVEFLINDVDEAASPETIIDPATNYMRWVALTDGRAYATPESSEAGDDEDGDAEQVSDEDDDANLQRALANSFAKREADDEDLYSVSDKIDTPMRKQPQKRQQMMRPSTRQDFKIDNLIKWVDSVQADASSVRDTTEAYTGVKVKVEESDNVKPAANAYGAASKSMSVSSGEDPVTPPPVRRAPRMNRFGAPIQARPGETIEDILASLNGSGKKKVAAVAPWAERPAGGEGQGE